MNNMSNWNGGHVNVSHQHQHNHPHDHNNAPPIPPFHPQVSPPAASLGGYLPSNLLSHSQGQDVYTSPSSLPFLGFTNAEQFEFSQRFSQQQRPLLSHDNCGSIPQPLSHHQPPVLDNHYDYGYHINNGNLRHNFEREPCVTVVDDDGTATQTYIMEEPKEDAMTTLPPPPQFLDDHSSFQTQDQQRIQLPPMHELSKHFRQPDAQTKMVPFVPLSSVHCSMPQTPLDGYQQTPLNLNIHGPPNRAPNIYDNANMLIHGRSNDKQSQLEAVLRSPPSLPIPATVPQTSPMDLASPSRLQSLIQTPTQIRHGFVSPRAILPPSSIAPLTLPSNNRQSLPKRSPQPSVIQFASTITPSNFSPSNSSGRSPGSGNRGASRRGRGRGITSGSTDSSDRNKLLPDSVHIYEGDSLHILNSNGVVKTIPRSLEVDANSRSELFKNASILCDSSVHSESLVPGNACINISQSGSTDPQTLTSDNNDNQQLLAAQSLLDLSDSGMERGSPRGRRRGGRPRGRGVGRGSPQKVIQDGLASPVRSGRGRGGRGRVRGTRGRGAQSPRKCLMQEEMQIKEMESVPPTSVPPLDEMESVESAPLHPDGGEVLEVQPIDSENHLSSLMKSCDLSIQNAVGSPSPNSQPRNPSDGHSHIKKGVPSPDITSPVHMQKEEKEKMNNEPSKPKAILESEENATKPDQSSETYKPPSVVKIKKRRSKIADIGVNVCKIEQNMQNAITSTLSISQFDRNRIFAPMMPISPRQPSSDLTCGINKAKETMQNRASAARKPTSVPSIFELKDRVDDRVPTTSNDAAQHLDQVKKEPSSPPAKVEMESVEKADAEPEPLKEDAVALVSIKKEPSDDADVQLEDIEAPSSVDSSRTVKLHKRRSISEVSDKTSGREEMSLNEDELSDENMKNMKQKRTSDVRRGGKGSARARRVLSSESKSSGNEECTRRTTRSKTAMQKNPALKTTVNRPRYAESSSESDSDYSPTRADDKFQTAMRLSVGERAGREIAKARRGRGGFRNRGNVANASNASPLKGEPDTAEASVFHQVKTEADSEDEKPDTEIVANQCRSKFGTIHSENQPILRKLGARVPFRKTYRPAYSPEEKERLYGDRAFVIDVADIERKPEDMYIWRIMKPERCLLQFYPAKYGGRQFHISTSSRWFFHEDDFTSEEFYLRFQPVQVDIAKEKVVFPETKFRQAVVECTIHFPYTDKSSFNRMIKQVGRVHKTEYLRQDFIKLNHLLSVMVFYPDAMTRPPNAKVEALFESRRKIESVIMKVVEKAVNQNPMLPEVIDKIRTFPHMTYSNITSAKNLKASTCSACNKRTSVVEVLFLSKPDGERPYDFETFQELPEASSKDTLERSYWCRECSFKARKIDRVIHYMYRLYRAIKSSMARTAVVLQRSCGNTQLTDAFLIWTQSLEMNWICDQFMDFRVFLADLENDVAPSQGHGDVPNLQPGLEGDEQKENVEAV